MHAKHDELSSDMRDRLSNLEGGFDWYLKELTLKLLTYRAYKDSNYEGSWAKRGLLGYWSGGLGRSIDRVDSTMQNVVGSYCADKTDNILVVHLIDTLVDVAMYALMGIAMLAVLFPSSMKFYMGSVDSFIASMEKKDA